jgi:penicillin-insensitive murein endopeptidase
MIRRGASWALLLLAMSCAAVPTATRDGWSASNLAFAGEGAEPVRAQDEARRALPPEQLALALHPDALMEAVGRDPTSLGSISLGRPNAGGLLNGVPMPAGERWEVVDATRAFATRETVAYLVAAIDKVHRQFPESHPLYIGHMSRERGGPMRPHRSHQSGRDVDISYYYRPDKAEWYRPATEGTLDLARSWAFVRALVTETDVEYVFINTSVQRLLKEYALSIGEDPGWLNEIFQYRSRHPEPIVRNAWGHRTHMHVRFYNPGAQMLGVRAFDALVKHHLVAPRNYVQRYRARPGDSLARVAGLAGTTPGAIQLMNGFDGDALEEGRVYALPMRGQVAAVKDSDLVVPPRRLPPAGVTGETRRVAAPHDG